MIVHASILKIFNTWTGGHLNEQRRLDHRSNLDPYRGKTACGAPVFESWDRDRHGWSITTVSAGWSSSVPNCPTCAVLYDEAVALHRPYTCTECGCEFEDKNYDVSSEEPYFQRCWECHFWLHREQEVIVMRKTQPRIQGEDRSGFTTVRLVDVAVIVNGTFYTVGDPVHEEPPRKTEHLGFGGARWDIEFNDGRRLTTHNLWHGGQIPERFRSRPAFHDNACFTNKAAREWAQHLARPNP